jgi:hypothetical protein
MLRDAQTVGDVYESSLSFSPNGPGMKTELTLRFALSMPLAEGETVSLALPRFFSATAAPGSKTAVRLNAGCNFTAFFLFSSPTDAVLRLSARSMLPAHHLQHVVVARSEGLSLPFKGINNEEKHNITLQSNAAQAALMAQRVQVLSLLFSLHALLVQKYKY